MFKQSNRSNRPKGRFGADIPQWVLDRYTPIRRVLLVLVALMLAVSIGMSLRPLVSDVPVIADISNLPVIIIDPGHGGMDGGAVGVDGIVEKEINLAISLMLRDMFEVCGFEVIMTRETDISIHDDGVEGLRRQKTSDLRNRLAIAQEHPGAVFISVHQNKFEQASSSGTQIFYGPLNPDSELFAGILQRRFVENLQPENHRQHKLAGKNLFILYNAECPVVLVECGFLSNADEARRLIDPEYQSKIAFTILASTLEYLELDAAAVMSPLQ